MKSRKYLILFYHSTTSHNSIKVSYYNLPLDSYDRHHPAAKPDKTLTHTSFKRPVRWCEELYWAIPKELLSTTSGVSQLLFTCLFRLFQKPSTSFPTLSSSANPEKPRTATQWLRRLSSWRFNSGKGCGGGALSYFVPR